MNHCIFCGSTIRKLTDEHVWPQWISKVFQTLGAEGYNVHGGMIDMAGAEQLRDPFRSNILNAKVKVVCKKCNSEDLSQLEDKYTKPILEPRDCNPDALLLERGAADFLSLQELDCGSRRPQPRCRSSLIRPSC